MVHLQLAIVHDQHNKRVLLGRKKKGFGEVRRQTPHSSTRLCRFIALQQECTQVNIS
jgi:hypothetical protein